MSGLKTILVPVAGPEGAAASVMTAALIAADHGSHITVVHVRPDIATLLPLIGEGLSAAMVEEMVTLSERDAGLRAAAVKAELDRLMALHALPGRDTPPGGRNGLMEGPSVGWVEQRGRSEEVVPLLGRTHDLIVLPRPPQEDGEPSVAVFNAALTESGRPVLLVPPRPPASVGRRVVVAWNQSIEATRAVAAAWPLLAKAETVSVLVAEDGRDCAPERLVAHLAWHGVTADIRHAEDDGRRFGPVLLTEADSRYADLIVMGAYTHSRLRQLVFGGATRHILTHANVPVLLCH